MNRKLKIGLFITGGLAVITTGVILFVKLRKSAVSKAAAAATPAKKPKPPKDYTLINTQDGAYYYVPNSEVGPGGYADPSAPGPFYMTNTEGQKAWLASKGYKPMSEYS